MISNKSVLENITKNALIKRNIDNEKKYKLIKFNLSFVLDCNNDGEAFVCHFLERQLRDNTNWAIKNFKINTELY